MWRVSPLPARPQSLAVPPAARPSLRLRRNPLTLSHWCDGVRRPPPAPPFVAVSASIRAHSIPRRAMRHHLFAAPLALFVAPPSAPFPIAATATTAGSAVPTTFVSSMHAPWLRRRRSLCEGEEGVICASPPSLTVSHRCHFVATGAPSSVCLSVACVWSRGRLFDLLSSLIADGDADRGVRLRPRPRPRHSLAIAGLIVVSRTPPLAVSRVAVSPTADHTVESGSLLCSPRRPSLSLSLSHRYPPMTSRGFFSVSLTHTVLSKFHVEANHRNVK